MKAKIVIQWWGLLVMIIIFNGNLYAGGSGSSSTYVNPPAGMPACIPNTAPGETSCSATPICDFNGYCGRTLGSYAADARNTPIQTAFENCLGNAVSIDNDSYLSFVASATSVSFDIYVYDCNSDQCIQLFMFSRSSCGSGAVTGHQCAYQLFARNNSYAVSVSGLTVGQTYYILIDGCSGNICSYTFVATAGVVQPININIPNPSVCSGGSVNLTATGGNGTYQWSGDPGLSTSSGASVTITPPVTPGTYNYKVESTGGTSMCPQSAEHNFAVTVNPTITPTISVAPASSTICNGGSVTLTASVTDGNASLVNWSNGSVGSSITVSPTTTTTYTATYTGTGACISTGTIFANSTVNVSNTSSSQQQAIVCSSNLPYIFGSQSLNTSGTYTEVFTNTTGCDSVVTLQLTVQNLPSISVTATEILCNSSTASATANVIVNPPGNYSYSWSGSSSVTEVAADLGGGNHTVRVGLSPTCYVEQAFTVNQQGVPVVQLASSGPTCYGLNNGSITANVSGGTSPYSYQWNGASSTSETVTSLGGGIYEVIVADANGCTGTASVTFSVPDELNVTINGVQPDCYTGGGQLTANATGGTPSYLYIWNNGEHSGETYVDPGIGLKYVVVTDANGCKDTASFQVAFLNGFDVDATATKTSILEGESVNLNATLNPYIPGVLYEWSNGGTLSCLDCPNPVASPTESVTYYVTITAPNGCQGVDSVFIFTKMNCGEIFLPTIFSPNGDGENDYFTPQGRCLGKGVLKIFDRWGRVVYMSEDLATGWDGTYNNKPLNTGVYVYIFSSVNLYGEAEEIKGTVTLVR